MRNAPDLTPIEDLDRNILKLCSRINVATYELLVLVREFDERAGFVQWGLQNCAEWLAWRCDLSMTTAREKVLDDEVLQIPDLADTSWSTRQADAFVNLVTGYLSGGDGATNDNYLVTVKAVSRAVRARDNGCCTFPGCRNQRFLNCHHVEHWSNGGETSMDNLMLLCTKHHALVHEGGFRIEKDFGDNWFFARPDGIAVPECGYVSRMDENPPARGLLSALGCDFNRSMPMT